MCKAFLMGWKKNMTFVIVIACVIINLAGGFTLPSKLRSSDTDFDVFYPVADDTETKDGDVVKAVRNLLSSYGYSVNEVSSICNNVTADWKLALAATEDEDETISKSLGGQQKQEVHHLISMKGHSHSEEPHELDIVHSMQKNHDSNEGGEEAKGKTEGRVDKASKRPNARLQLKLSKETKTGQLGSEPSDDSVESTTKAGSDLDTESATEFSIEEGEVAVIEEDDDGSNIEIVVQHGNTHDTSVRNARDDKPAEFTIVEELRVGDDDENASSSGDGQTVLESMDGNGGSQSQKRVVRQEYGSGDQAVDLRPEVLEKIILAQHMAKRNAEKAREAARSNNVEVDEGMSKVSHLNRRKRV